MDKLNNCTVNAYFTNPVASCLDKAGRILTYPANFHAEQIAKVVCPLKPGRADQLKCVWAELAMRVARVFLCVVLLSTIPVGIVGLGLQSIASYARREFVLICPDKSSPENNKRVKELKIATYNAYLMPSWIRMFIHQYRSPYERVQAIAEAVLDRDVDVFCMQEMFDLEAALKFIEIIKSKYPYIAYNFNHGSFKIGSGLLIASRFPIENPRCWEHATKIGTERLSKKGTMAVTIRLNSDQRIPLFNTHLEAGIDDPAKAIPCRVSQLQDIQGYLQEYCKHFDFSFFCGDMNIPSKKESADLAKLKEIITINPGDVARDKGTMHKALPRIHSDSSCDCLDTVLEDQDIDYIGVLKSSKCQPKLLQSYVDCMKGTSDHLAAFATYEISS